MTVERVFGHHSLRYIVRLGERHLRAVVHDFVEHYRAERNHRGLGKVILFPSRDAASPLGRIGRRERLGGVLSFYERKGAGIRRDRESEHYASQGGRPVRILALFVTSHRSVTPIGGLGGGLTGQIRPRTNDYGDAISGTNRVDPAHGTRAPVASPICGSR